MKCLVSGYFGHCACLQPQGYYFTVKEHQLVAIHPSSILNTKPAWVVYHEFVLTNKNYIRLVSTLNPRLLLEIANEYLELDDMSNNFIKKELLKIKKQIEDEAESD